MIGASLSQYRITAAVGAGGMGEVYRATDTQLGREVAIKVLPADVAADPDRLARFEREARLLASLNHPNIAHVYAFESATLPDGASAHFLAMELVEGEDLSERLKRGPIPVEEALEIAKQIAEALEEAHERGIVHRDLKPANVKLTSDGKVKVLDFGLAKAYAGEAAGSSPGLSQSPTLAHTGTQAGVILGTAAYMSPEQARGKLVDKRADIWAFGVVFWEMLTGEQLFAGGTVSDILALVLTREPDWLRLPARTPPAARRLLQRCLARDRRERLRDIGDALLELREAPEPGTVAADSTPRSAAVWLPWLVAVFAAAFGLWALWSRSSPAPVSVAEGHFTIELPPEAPLVTLDLPSESGGPLAVSPDGRHVVYVAPQGSGTRLFARALNDPTPRALPGTEGARFPFFSPDGQWVGFFADGKLKKTPLAGGTPTTLAEAPDGRGGSWDEAGEILFAPRDGSGLALVPDAGGTPRVATRLDFAAGDDSHRWPQLLPGGRRALLTVVAWSRETSEIVVVDLSTGERRTVQPEAEFARYVPAGPGAATGQLVFVRAGALVAAPFDPSGDGPAGAPVAVVEGVSNAQFDISASGLLAYTPASGKPVDYSLVWVDRNGGRREINDLRRGYEDLHLSPDGRRVALTVEEAGPDSAAHVWLADTGRGTLTRFTFEGFSRDPVWAPDGASIVFGSKRGETTFGLYRQRLDGGAGAELLWASPDPIWPDPSSFTPDGTTLVFVTKGKETAEDIWTLSLDGVRVARPWLRTPANEWAGRLSPDGRWMAYNSDESGRIEVYVQPFPGPGGKWLISQEGGANPIWSRDGRSLFYRRGDEMLVVDVDTSAGFAVGKPVRLFAGRYRLTGRDFDVSADGTRLVMMHNDDPRTTSRLGLLLDWWSAAGARSRVP